MAHEGLDDVGTCSHSPASDSLPREMSESREISYQRMGRAEIFYSLGCYISEHRTGDLVPARVGASPQGNRKNPVALRRKIMSTCPDTKLN